MRHGADVTIIHEDWQELRVRIRPEHHARLRELMRVRDTTWWSPRKTLTSVLDKLLTDAFAPAPVSTPFSRSSSTSGGKSAGSRARVEKSPRIRAKSSTRSGSGKGGKR